jgi:hypothetical protein
MSYYSHTILKCTKPDIIASGSTFVSETDSMFHETINGQSHFFTWRNTMDDEIVKLSTRHPEETLTTECHWDNESPNSLIYKNEFKNGIQKLLGVEPEYFFCRPVKEYPNKKHFEAFKDHVLKYLSRLDVVKAAEGGYEIDRLDGEEDKYGYKSSVTITYENDHYIWSAKKNGSAYISITVNKKDNRPPVWLAEINSKYGLEANEDYYELPF